MDAEENRVIPTLALANEIGQGRPHLRAEKERLLRSEGDKRLWKAEAQKFTLRYGGLRPVRVAEGSLILEKQPLSVDIDYDVSGQYAKGIMVNVYPNRKLALPEDVGTVYEEKLSGAEISCDEKHTARLSFSFRNRALIIDIEPGAVVERLEEPQSGWRIDKASFPHPRLVAHFYRMLREEFAQELATRMRGKPPETKNLVPACVAFFLRAYGLEGRVEVHRLLNKYVLSEIGKQLAVGHTDAETFKLWRDVGNDSLVGNPLRNSAWTLFYEGYEY